MTWKNARALTFIGTLWSTLTSESTPTSPMFIWSWQVQAKTSKQARHKLFGSRKPITPFCASKAEHTAILRSIKSRSDCSTCSMRKIKPLLSIILTETLSDPSNRKGDEKRGPDMIKWFFKGVTWLFRTGMSLIASLAPLFGVPRSFFMICVGLVLPIIFIAVLAQLWLHGRGVLIAIGLLFVVAVLFDGLRHLIKPRMRKDTYGTAHFATPREIKPLLTRPNDPTRLLIGTY